MRPLPLLGKERAPQAMGEQVINEEMHQAKDAHIFSTPRVDRDTGFHAELEVFPKPDQPRVDRAGRLATTAAIQTGLQSELNYGDHPIEGHPQSHIFDEGLQILEVVLEGNPPGEGDRVALDRLGELPAEGIYLGCDGLT